MKKFFSFLMLGVFALSLSSCHEKTKEEKEKEQMEQVQKAAEATGELLKVANDLANTAADMAEKEDKAEK